MRYPGSILHSEFILATAFCVEPVAIELPSEERWEFGFAPYLWATNLEGSVAQFGLNHTDIDVSFSDILANLDIASTGCSRCQLSVELSPCSFSISSFSPGT